MTDDDYEPSPMKFYRDDYDDPEVAAERKRQRESINKAIDEGRIRVVWVEAEEKSDEFWDGWAKAIEEDEA